MVNVKKKIIYGSAIDIIGTIIGTVLGFVIIRLYFKVISKEEFGVWLAVNSVASLVALVDLGIDQYFTTLLSNDTVFNSKEISKEISNVLIVKTIIVIFFALIGLVLYWFLASIIKIPVPLLKIAKATYLINLLLLMVSVLFATTNTVLISRNHFSLVNSILVFGNIASSILTYIFLKLGYQIVSFPLALLVIAFIQFIIMWIVIKRAYPHLSLGRFNLKGKKEMFSYSFSFQVLKWAFIIRNQYLVIALNNFVGISMVTAYNMTNRLPAIVPTYMNKLISPFFPTFAKLAQTGQKVELRHIFIKILKILARFSVFFLIAMLLFNKSFIMLWVGADKYTGAAIELWLIIYMFVISACCGFGTVMFATKKFEKWTLFSVMEIFFVIILSYLGNRFFGAAGLLGGFVIGSIFTQLYTASLAFKQLDVSFLEVFFSVYKYVLYPNLTSLVVGIVILYTIELNTWINLIVAVAVFSISHFITIEVPRILTSKKIGIKSKLVEALDL